MLQQLLKGVEDRLFYEQHDFSEQVSAALSASLAPYLVCLTGPRVHAVGEHPALPVYVCFKENDEDNADISTESHGNLVMSSAVTGELRVMKLYVRDKEPARRDGEVDYPPGYEPSPTTYYRSEYKLVPADRLPRACGDLVSIVQSGNFASEPYRCELRREPEESSEDPWASRLRQEDGDDPAGEDHVTMATVETSPAPPIGFRVEVPAPATLSPGEAVEVVCRFVLPDDGTPEVLWVPVHLLLSGRQFRQLEVETVLVPKEATSVADGLRSGRFTIDLSRHFYHPERGGRTFDDDFYVTLVSRDQFSPPVRVPVKRND